MVAPKVKAEIEPRLPALQPISGGKRIRLPPSGTQHSSRHWSGWWPPREEGVEEGVREEGAKHSEGDFPPMQVPGGKG
jgi:hypothetical protein